MRNDKPQTDSRMLMAASVCLFNPVALRNLVWTAVVMASRKRALRKACEDYNAKLAERKYIAPFQAKTMPFVLEFIEDAASSVASKLTVIDKKLVINLAALARIIRHDTLDAYKMTAGWIMGREQVFLVMHNEDHETDLKKTDLTKAFTGFVEGYNAAKATES